MKQQSPYTMNKVVMSPSSVTNGCPSIILVGSVAVASRFIEVHMGFRWVFCDKGLILISAFLVSLACCACNFLLSVATTPQGFRDGCCTDIKIIGFSEIILYLSKIHVRLTFDKALDILVPR